jgi:hypothetical protein
VKKSIVFQSLRFSVIGMALALLGACASLGLATPQTFNQKLAVGYASVTALRDTTNTLATAKTITVNDARNIEAQLDNARAALDIAKSTYATDPTGAQSKVDTALTALTALQTYMTSRGK